MAHPGPSLGKDTSVVERWWFVMVWGVPSENRKTKRNFLEVEYCKVSSKIVRIAVLGCGPKTLWRLKDSTIECIH